MIVLFTAGQLGNQIFQYGFIENIKNKDEKVITSKCEYFEVFEYKCEEYIFINKYGRFTLRRILKLFAALRLISSIYQNKEISNDCLINSDSYTYKRGLISFVKIVEGFYQFRSFGSFMPIVNAKYIREVENYFLDIPKSSQKVFIHIRRGDYLRWSIFGKKNPSLPLSYYKKAISLMQESLEDPFFIFLGDDYKYIEEEFSYVENKKISNKNEGFDIAIMRSCENAIISNSTFSWWGANLTMSRNKIIAPKFWLGWKSEVWYPKGIDLDFVEYIDVGE